MVACTRPTGGLVQDAEGAGRGGCSDAIGQPTRAADQAGLGLRLETPPLVRRPGITCPPSPLAYSAAFPWQAGSTIRLASRLARSQTPDADSGGSSLCRLGDHVSACSRRARRINFISCLKPTTIRINKFLFINSDNNNTIIIILPQTRLATQCIRTSRRRHNR